MAGVRKAVTYEKDENGCYICTSHALGTHGYPCVWKDGRNQNLHKVLYEEKHGIIPSGMVIRHKCDVRACIRMSHLVKGTKKQNTQDMVRRGRCNPVKGKKHANYRLSDKKVLRILKASGSQHSIAKRTGVNQSTVSRIKRGVYRDSHV